ncbi:hypothetical protein NUU61_006636 [Penicillium alfredii]|uniref:Lipoprotein n=1 Tax=Penicillium alfredii TaxID=1506179 RepID=A0A9W9F1I2_9EURO|nr:uncharacterized protein NUU61_006636 [Penicillium alfredii]KAJ5091766.1 hypothetical protein NUU61_006636 [Penicillium alfredii]
MRPSFLSPKLRIAPLLVATLSILATGCTAATVTNSLLLASIAEQLALPAMTWSANGTHTAKGFTTQQADTASAEGLKADCDNINLNKKLATDFRSDVLGAGVTGFFFKCESVSADTNKYWFTISSGSSAQIDKLCDSNTKYPIVFDKQHNTWFIDEPFDCARRTSPTDVVGS